MVDVLINRLHATEPIVSPRATLQGTIVPMDRERPPIRSLSALSGFLKGKARSFRKIHLQNIFPKLNQMRPEARINIYVHQHTKLIDIKYLKSVYYNTNTWQS